MPGNTPSPKRASSKESKVSEVKDQGKVIVDLTLDDDDKLHGKNNDNLRRYNNAQAHNTQDTIKAPLPSHPRVLIHLTLEKDDEAKGVEEEVKVVIDLTLNDDNDESKGNDSSSRRSKKAHGTFFSRARTKLAPNADDLQSSYLYHPSRQLRPYIKSLHQAREPQTKTTMTMTLRMKITTPMIKDSLYTARGGGAEDIAVDGNLTT
ncbi:hypothetical protein QBC38DRAFT_453892 [Podospora fimiseda]|uniref:Uncharacterized protein n=1 Tax=Podospora fimiseda TaxID=252190 RepID=A0AAN7H5X9_9PEZI|nr:hypothetical protein QBC38DRAFT_453892 [Podospora fimiseda]